MTTSENNGGPLGNTCAYTTTSIEQVEKWRLAEVTADKELRRDLDAQLQKLKGLPASHERVLAGTKLREAIMWLGMDLKRLNEADPYPTSRDPSSSVIEPTADGLRL